LTAFFVYFCSMLFQKLETDIATISKSAKGRVLFYNANGDCVLGVSEQEDVQLNFLGGYIYIFQKGAGSTLYDTTNPTSQIAINGSLYKFTVWGLTDIDGRPFTALANGTAPLEDYTAKVREAYEYLVGNVFVGCCGTSTNSVLWYADEASFPATGLTETLYVDMATPALFLWDGAAYVAFGGGSGGGVESVTGYSVDNTDPLNPIVNAIPLAGTASGSPVTGTIEFDNPSEVQTWFKSLESENVFVQIINTGKDADGFQINSYDFDAGNSSFIYVYPTLVGMTTNGMIELNAGTVMQLSVGAAKYARYASQRDESDLEKTSLIDLAVMKSRIWTKAGTPTTTDDITQGYIVGSLIWDTTNSILYRCTSNTATAAAWANVWSALPISTATQTALNLKADATEVLRYINITDSAAITGTTGATYIRSQLIPANTFAVGDVIRIRQRGRKTGTAGVTTMGIYINTVDTFAGSTIIGAYTTTAATHLWVQMKRDFYIKSATVTEGMTASGTAPVDEISFLTAATNTNINWAVDQYIIFTVNPNAAGDSYRQSGYIIEKL